MGGCFTSTCRGSYCQSYSSQRCELGRTYGKTTANVRPSGRRPVDQINRLPDDFLDVLIDAHLLLPDETHDPGNRVLFIDLQLLHRW